MRPRISNLTTALLAAMFGACTLEPTYHRPPSPVPVPESAAPGRAAAADIGWREFFPDPQLQQLIELALANNRDLRVAALNVETAQAQYRVSRAQLLPTVDASAVEQAERIPLSVAASSADLSPAAIAALPPSVRSGIVAHTYNAGIGFTNYELDVFGHIRSLNHVALQQYFSLGETRRSAQITLVAEVAAAYLVVLADQTLLDITTNTLQSQNESFALTQRLFTGGTSTELALRQAESTVDSARANLAQYHQQIAQDRDALQLLLGAPIPDGIDFSAGLDRSNMVSELEEGIPSDVLVNRPDVRAAEHQLQATNAQIGAARAAFFPAISLTGNFGTESVQLSGLFKDHSEAWSFSPQVSVPIFAGGANLANLRASKLSRETAVAQYEKAIQSAFREVADALAARGALNDQLDALQALVRDDSAAYRLADMRYRGGVDSYLSALDAQRTLYSAQQQLQGVRLARLQNLVTLYKALGGGLLEHASVARMSPLSSTPEPPLAHPGLTAAK